MTCEELKNIVKNVNKNGIGILSDDDIWKLLISSCDHHNQVCDCGEAELYPN